MNGRISCSSFLDDEEIVPRRYDFEAGRERFRSSKLADKEIETACVKYREFPPSAKGMGIHLIVHVYRPGGDLSAVVFYKKCRGDQGVHMV